ncbi:MAG: hypothetical protein ABIS37_11355 [Bacteroidia bacterium]
MQPTHILERNDHRNASVNPSGSVVGYSYNSKIKRNFFKKGFVRLVKYCASKLYLWLMKRSSYESLFKKTSLIPSSLCATLGGSANSKFLWKKRTEINTANLEGSFIHIDFDKSFLGG